MQFRSKALARIQGTAIVSATILPSITGLKKAQVVDVAPKTMKPRVWELSVRGLSSWDRQSEAA